METIRRLASAFKPWGCRKCQIRKHRTVIGRSYPTIWCLTCWRRWLRGRRAQPAVHVRRGETFPYGDA